jgi:hypothetical protein
MPNATVHAQTFAAAWPAVLDDMLEYIALTQLSLGKRRQAQIRVTLSRQLVAADLLQPHVDRFQARLREQLPGARLSMQAAHASEHRVELRFAG